MGTHDLATVAGTGTAVLVPASFFFAAWNSSAPRKRTTPRLYHNADQQGHPAYIFARPLLRLNFFHLCQLRRRVLPGFRRLSDFVDDDTEFAVQVVEFAFVGVC